MSGTDTVQALKEKSQKRRRLICQQLGARDPDTLSTILGSRNEGESKKEVKRKSEIEASSSIICIPEKNEKLPLETIVEKEESDDVSGVMMYKDSSTFLKGTQSANPHNDYCQHFVDTGQRPQNFIRDVDDYRKATRYLEEQGMEYHFYHLKKDIPTSCYSWYSH